MKLEAKNLPELKLRLDKYLADNTDYSRANIAKMIKNGHILVNDKIEKNSYIVKENDIIFVEEKIKTSDITPFDFKLDIIYEDNDILVINKPSGLVVHPGNGNKDNTLVNALVHYGKTLSSVDEIRPGIVHRIDKDTSGIILVAKNNKAHEILADDFKHKRIKREYIALLDGVVPNNKIVIDAPIGRDNTHRKEMAIKSDNSKKAVTHLTVLKRYSAYTLVSLVLETGRTHQIRVHTAYIGYPVFNDPVYNHKKSDDFGQFLHSSAVTFIHPITKKELHFECPLPDKFQNFLDTIS